MLSNTHFQITSGTYTGNSSANRAIPHGLGRIPKYVTISNTSIATIAYIFGNDPAKVQYAPAGASFAVTAMTATNFYVGNATEYAQSVNLNAATYYWIAFG